jgi:hypothetical protein
MKSNWRSMAWMAGTRRFREVRPDYQRRGHAPLDGIELISQLKRNCARVPPAMIVSYKERDEIGARIAGGRGLLPGQGHFHDDRLLKRS